MSYQKCGEAIAKEIINSGNFQLLYNNKTHPCNNLYDDELKNIFKQYKNSGYRIKSIRETIEDDFGFDITVNVGKKIEK
jgi:hypothetical protein